MGSTRLILLECGRYNSLAAESTPGQRMGSLLRLLGYLWAAPVTVLGLCMGLLTLASGGQLRWRQGVIEVSGGLVAWLLRGNRFWHGGAAVALGHVILARDQECLVRSRQHESVHVRQYERWGVFLWPAYLLFGWRLARKGYHPYLDHPFEKEADGSGPTSP